ncbi:hypothetical protein C4577_03435 [Candidatus Parcubacteria bacterium]|nr:MAG: hypothetical protein C4577_03435 [Candidatus Parcubacteria bacterium]
MDNMEKDTSIEPKIAIKGADLPDITGGQKETLPALKPNRVVIYGSRLSGGPLLAKELQDYLEQAGVENPEAIIIRDVDLIARAFYNVPPNADFDPKNPPKNNLPKGVIILPEMRQYHNGWGMTVSMDATNLSGKTLKEYITELCDNNGVPNITVEPSTPNDKLPEMIKSLLPPQTK